VLGVIPASEGLVLMRLIRDMTSSAADFTVVVLVVALITWELPGMLSAWRWGQLGLILEGQIERAGKADFG
jgi:hypothetical protein